MGVRITESLSQALAILETEQKWSWSMGSTRSKGSSRHQSPRAVPTVTGMTNGTNAGTAGWLSQEFTSVRFASMARQLSESARELDLAAPGFRSPPRTAGVRRSIRHEIDGSATVSVSLRGRPALAVVADMIDGIVASAQLDDHDGAKARDVLWVSATGLLDEQFESSSSSPARRAA